MSTVILDHIRAAAVRIKPLVHRTPVLKSRTFDKRSGVETFFKCENLQRCGAFKMRGAANFILSIPEADRPRGVVAYSSGNHGQAVALVAHDMGIPATIVMPKDAPSAKIEATRGYGARVVTYDRAAEDREAIGRGIAEETGAALAPPYDHPWTIAGAGTAALELLEETGPLDALVVCVGGGGLISGSAIAAKGVQPDIRVFGVEPEAANDTWLSFQAGERVEIPLPKTSADGLMTPQPGAITFPLIQEHVESVLLVSEQEIRDTVKFLLTRMKILAEPSGAVSPAAVLFGKLPPWIRRAGVIISGGNADLEFLKTLGD